MILYLSMQQIQFLASYFDLTIRRNLTHMLKIEIISILSLMIILLYLRKSADICLQKS